MHAHLIIGRDQQLIQEKVDEIIGSENVQSIEYQLKKIDEVRELANMLKLSSKNNRTIIIRDFHKASTQAMSAFLKNLEEPKSGVNYIIVSKTTYGILPTILSRVNLIKLSVESNEFNKSTLAGTFIKKGLSDKLKQVDKFRKREDALEFINEFIFSGHSHLTKKSENLLELAFAINSAIECKINIEKNGNLNLHLSKFVLQIDR